MAQSLARALVFCTSASVLVIEIIAVRLLAPYLGVSLEVFTGVIGVILAGISLGAWLGGRAADRRPPRSLIGPLLIAGGLTTLASPLLIDFVGPSLSTDPVSIVIAAAVGFMAPAATLSAVPPVIVKIQLESLEQTGTVVGSYSAIGTAGAILGTFLTGFILIAAFPTRPVVFVLGALITLTGLTLSLTGRIWAASIVVAGLLGTGLLALQGPCEHETTYHCAIVVEDEQRPSGRTLVLDRLSNSYVDLEDPTYLKFRYIQLIADVFETALPQGPLDVVSIGGGGFTLPGYLEATRPGGTNLVLEIDSKLVEIGRTELSLDETVDVVVDDARVSLGDVPPGSTQLVIGDAYSGASVPWHLTTVEFNQQISEVLAPGGLYVMNVIDYPLHRAFVRAEARTLREVFDNVALFAPRSYLTGENGGNYILVASDSPIDIAAVESQVRSRGGIEVGISGQMLTDFIGDAHVLTDDYAPVDQLLLR